MTFRMLEPDEVADWPSDFRLGQRVCVHMRPWDPWNGKIVRLKWFTGDKPGSEPIYEVLSDDGKGPAGYSGYWLQAIG